jgi:hypothetical protein
MLLTTYVSFTGSTRSSGSHDAALHVDNGSTGPDAIRSATVDGPGSLEPRQFASDNEVDSDLDTHAVDKLHEGDDPESPANQAKSLATVSIRLDIAAKSESLMNQAEPDEPMSPDPKGPELGSHAQGRDFTW